MAPPLSLSAFPPTPGTFCRRWGSNTDGLPWGSYRWRVSGLEGTFIWLDTVFQRYQCFHANLISKRQGKTNPLNIPKKLNLVMEDLNENYDTRVKDTRLTSVFVDCYTTKFIKKLRRWSFCL